MWDLGKETLGVTMYVGSPLQVSGPHSSVRWCCRLLEFWRRGAGSEVRILAKAAQLLMGNGEQ